MSPKKYLVLDDVCYSTQLVVAELMAKLYMRICEEPELIENDLDAENFLVTKAVLEYILGDERCYARGSLYNSMMSRPIWLYLTIDDDFLEWLLSKFTNLDDIDVRCSGISQLIGTPDVYCVYQPSNRVELLVLKKLGLLGVLDNLITDDEMIFRLKKEKLQYSDKKERSAIFTANEIILDNLHEDFVLLGPISFPWIKDRAVVAVEAWIFDKIEEDKELKEDINNDTGSNEGSTEEGSFGNEPHRN